jgi:protein-S-isoprenylcysteine O-methyltransferase Ste14
METIFTAFRSLLYATGFFTVSLYLAFSIRNLDQRIPAALPATSAGLVLIAAGLTLAIASVAAFVTQGHGTPAPFDAPRRFVARWPYSMVRNPMYIGGLTALCGLEYRIPPEKLRPPRESPPRSRAKPATGIIAVSSVPTTNILDANLCSIAKLLLFLH